MDHQEAPQTTTDALIKKLHERPQMPLADWLRPPRMCTTRSFACRTRRRDYHSYDHGNAGGTGMSGERFGAERRRLDRVEYAPILIREAQPKQIHHARYQFKDLCGAVENAIGLKGGEYGIKSFT